MKHISKAITGALDLWRVMDRPARFIFLVITLAFFAAIGGQIFGQT